METTRIYTVEMTKIIKDDCLPKEEESKMMKTALGIAFDDVNILKVQDFVMEDK